MTVNEAVAEIQRHKAVSSRATPGNDSDDGVKSVDEQGITFNSWHLVNPKEAEEVEYNVVIVVGLKTYETTLMEAVTNGEIITGQVVGHDTYTGTVTGPVVSCVPKLVGYDNRKTKYEERSYLLEFSKVTNIHFGWIREDFLDKKNYCSVSLLGKDGNGLCYFDCDVNVLPDLDRFASALLVVCKNVQKVTMNPSIIKGIVPVLIDPPWLNGK